MSKPRYHAKMLAKYLAVIVMYAVYSTRIVTTSDASKNYGAFNLSITQFDVCKGPKQKDCASSSASINSYNSILYEITVLRSISPSKGKVIAISNGKEFLRLQVKKTCEHLFLRPLFGALMNVTSDCIVVKGHYQFTIDIQAIAKQYFGGTFLFGNWTFKSIFYSDECNFSCSVIEVKLFPLGT